jgi:hypothetical protein
MTRNFYRISGISIKKVVASNEIDGIEIIFSNSWRYKWEWQEIFVEE